VIVLRLRIGQSSHDIRSASPALVVGSDPTADVTLAHPDLAPRALRLVRQDSEVAVELIGTDKRAVLRVGDEIELAGVGVALVGLLPLAAADSTPIFGGYEDAAPPAGSAPGSTRTFELSDTTTSGAPAEPVPKSPASLHPSNAPKTNTPASKPAASPPAASASPEHAAEPGRRSTRKRDQRRRTAEASAALPRADKPKPLTPAERAANLKAVKFAEPDFPTELLATLKRSPFYAFSIAFHLLILFILSLIHTTDVRPLREGPGAIKASMMAEDDELGEEVPELEMDGLPKEPEDLPDLAELEFEELTPPAEEKPVQPSPLRIDEDVLEDPDPPQIGIMPSLRAANRQVRPRKPKMPKTNVKKTFTKGAAGASNAAAAKVVRAQLGRGRYGSGVTLDDLDDDDILVVGGSFDHIERVLDALRLEYVKKAPWALTTPKPETFSKHKIIFWNCGESLGRRRMATIGKNLQKFVRGGGYLFTTDWGVANVLPFAFPGYIKTNGNRAHLPEMVLQIQPTASARNHPLLEGVFLPGVKGKWWLEQASFDMSVGRKDAVTMLIECPALHDQFNRSPSVAATFHYGRGRVLHTMGHYFQEAGNIAGTISVHRLALNFVLMRLDQDRKARSR